MTLPTDYRFSADHEWVNAPDPKAGATVRIGITDVATEALGDVVFVELPEVGARLTAGVACGEIESTKTVSDLVAPVTGDVTAINDDVVADPAVVNSDPYGVGWLLEVVISEDPADLLDADGYTELRNG